MSKKQWGVLCAMGDEYSEVCDPTGNDYSCIEPNTKEVCQSFIDRMSSYYTNSTYKLFKFKIKETI